MAGFRNVQEILRVPAPELVFLTILVDSSSTGGHWSPVALEHLTDCFRELNEVTVLGGEHSQEEGSLL
jgi:hypothetical protein